MQVETTKSSADQLEGIAFQFCKVATVALLCGRFTLPVAALLCAVLYVVAFVKGKRDSRCVLRYPLLIAGFWGLIAAVWIAFAVNPSLGDSVLHLVGR